MLRVPDLFYFITTEAFPSKGETCDAALEKLLAAAENAQQSGAPPVRTCTVLHTFASLSI